MPKKKSEKEVFTDEVNIDVTQITTDPNLLAQYLYNIWWHWADFSLFIIYPTIDVINPPMIIPPRLIAGTEDLEFVYPIYDHGYKLAASKAEDMFSSGMSMCRLYFTIEKMIFLLVERLKAAGVDETTEVQVAFGGHQLSQRKAFESVINLGYNVIVTNFEPGTWGERYLEIVKRLYDKGYGYPPEAPRDNYLLPRGQAPKMG